VEAESIKRSLVLEQENPTNGLSVIRVTERNYGAEVNGRSYWSQCREAYLLVLTHNLGALLFIELFYRAGQDSWLPFRGRPRGRTVLCRPSLVAICNDSDAVSARFTRRSQSPGRHTAGR
jgi:hypothetical protein